MIIRVLICFLLVPACVSAPRCKGVCADVCSKDKLELKGVFDCPVDKKCCVPRGKIPAFLARINPPYLVLSACGTILVLYLCWRFYVYYTVDPRLNLHKYVWPHDACSAPLPFTDVRFEEQSEFTNQDNQRIITFYSPPRFRAGNALVDPSRPRAVLLFVPPLGSHMQRYTLLPSIASGLGYATYGMDHFGFGQSIAGTKPETGQLNDFEVLVRDVLDFAGRVQESHPDIPLFMLGHGLGATIAALCVHRDPHLFAGVVYAAPVFTPFWTTFQQALIHKLGARFPHMRLRAVCWPAPDITSSNRAMEECNMTDPLYAKGPIPLGTALQILNLMHAACDCIPETSTHMLLQQGAKDLVSFGAGKHLAKSKAIIKDNFVNKDAWHDIFGSYHSPEIISNILDWIQDRVQASFLATTLD